MGRNVKFEPADMYEFAAKVARFSEGLADLDKDLRLAEGVVSATWDDGRQREFADAVRDCSRSIVHLHELTQGYVSYLRRQADRGDDYLTDSLPQR